MKTELKAAITQLSAERNLPKEAAFEQQTKLDDKKAYANGVVCTTCHSFTHYKGIKKPDGKMQLGIASYEVDTEQLHGPSGISYTKKRVPKDAKWPTPVHHPQPMQGSRSGLFKKRHLHGLP